MIQHVNSSAGELPDLVVAPAAPADWDEYVRSHPAGTAYHRSEVVNVGASAFKLRTYFVSARSASRLVGVLPLAEQSSLVFGRYLISVPFFTYGGLLADNPSVAKLLAKRAAELARERKAGHVELRQSSSVPGLELAERLDKVSLVLGLPDSEQKLADNLGSKLRSQIKRAEREQPEICWGNAELIPEFYGVFAESMHKLGTPVYPRRFFDLVCAALGNDCRVLVVRAGGRVAAGAIIVRHNDTIEVPWAAATDAAKRGALNMRMYWEMLREAVGSGASAFDFGRSSVDSGTYRFKRQWGAQPRQLHWYYWLPAGAPIPTLNHTNPKYALAATLWRRMPLWCANLLGPRISRNLP
jgi:FemAB-related protein (PEP-CTERM system-associated)